MSSVTQQSSLVSFLRKEKVNFLVNEPLWRHSTWKIGGPADLFVEPPSWKQVGVLLRYATENDLPVIVIGKGSNLLFDDAGLRGIVIKIGRKLSHLTISSTTVEAETGISSIKRGVVYR